MKNNPPILSIDFKKNRIRIHKHTLHLLGDPDYIQLLINPSSRMIAIRKSVRDDYLAHRVKHQQVGTKNCYELYSTHLMHTLFLVNENWSKGESYRFYGDFHPKEGIAQFSMDKGMLVTDLLCKEE